MRGSREISLVPSLHRASTDALIYLCVSIHYMYRCDVYCSNQKMTLYAKNKRDMRYHSGSDAKH